VTHPFHPLSGRDFEFVVYRQNWGEFEQLALNSLVSPGVVLGGELRDQRSDLGADRRSSYAVRVGPLAGNQAAVPAQDGARGNQTVHPQP